jgi:hypothetical protein
MNRRELMKSGAVTVTTGMFGLWPTIRAYAGTPVDTLVVVTEYGPNSLVRHVQTAAQRGVS